MSHACSTRTQPWPATTAHNPEQTVADVSKRPGALQVLQRFGINHCCGAHLSLREAAAAAGVPVDELLRALNEPVSTPA